VTRKGQVTLPATIRRRLQVSRGDVVRFDIEGDIVRVTRAQDVVHATAGVVKSSRPPLSPDGERRLIEHLIAEDVLRRSGG